MRKMPRNKKDHPFESFERVPFGGDSQTKNAQHCDR
jgi:hypothetical protein